MSADLDLEAQRQLQINHSCINQGLLEVEILVLHTDTIQQNLQLTKNIGVDYGGHEDAKRRRYNLQLSYRTVVSSPHSLHRLIQHHQVLRNRRRRLIKIQPLDTLRIVLLQVVGRPLFVFLNQDPEEAGVEVEVDYQKKYQVQQLGACFEVLVGVEVPDNPVYAEQPTQLEEALELRPNIIAMEFI